MKIKISEAERQALDYLVAKCEGVNEEAFRLYYEPTESTDYDSHGYPEFHYSTIWSQGGPIIEREKMTVESLGTGWLATRIEPPAFSEAIGPTPLIAAMRCYIASKLGEEVEVPDEIVS